MARSVTAQAAAPQRVDPVAAATYFVSQLGCAAFPVWGSREGICACGDPHDGTEKWGADNVGKHPATLHGFKDGTKDLERIRTFLSNPGTPNYGLRPPKGVLAIDVDQAEGIARWDKLQREYGDLPLTLTTITANGRHYFFRWPAGELPKGQLFGFVVRRWDDGYVIGPGSVHPSGFVYDTLRQASGFPYDIADLPESWVEAASRPRLTIVAGSSQELPAKGGRHDWLRNRARHLRGVIDEPAVLRAAILAENARLDEPKSEAEVERAIGEVFERFGLDPEAETEERSRVKLREDETDLLGAPTSEQFPDPPDPAAFGGLLGEMVAQLAPGTDASVVGLLGSLIAFAGALIPGKAYFHGSHTSSPLIALVGESSVGRKGTAMRRAQDAMSECFQANAVNRVLLDGINSGEGLISAMSLRQNQTMAGEPCVGLLFEDEFASLLVSRSREGSTIDSKMRAAFDGSQLSNRKAGDSKSVTAPYWLPGLVGITPSELRLLMGPGAMQNGSANRWLYLPVHRRDFMPVNVPPVFDQDTRARLIEERRKALANPPTLGVDQGVIDRLSAFSDFLPGVSFGLSRDLVKRLQVITFRVALVHALVDGSSRVTQDHLARALALAEYARRGVSWIFGDTIGNPEANLLFRHLTAVGRLTRTTITREIIRDPVKRQAAIDELLRIGRAQVVNVQTGGRSRMELHPTPNTGAFVPFFQVPATEPTESVETSGNVEESAPEPVKNVEESREEVGNKSDDTTPTSNALTRPDGSIWCHFAREHYAQHTAVSSSDPHCDICSPKETA